MLVSIQDSINLLSGIVDPLVLFDQISSVGDVSMESKIDPKQLEQDIKIEIHGGDQKLKPSIKKHLELELKKLLNHLDYDFLAEDSKFPVIISSSFSVEQKRKLVDVLKQHKGSIAWKIEDIKGINLSFCNPKILLENNFKLVVQLQRSLNLNMKKVVKAEVIKLLDVGVIYRITNGSQVRSVQVVLKMGA